MTDKLEFIIDNAKKSISVLDTSDKEITNKTIIRLGMEYIIRLDSKHDNLLTLLFQDRLRNEALQNVVRNDFEKYITSKYSDLTIRTHFSGKEKLNAAEIRVPKDKYKIVIN